MRQGAQLGFLMTGKAATATGSVQDYETGTVCHGAFAADIEGECDCVVGNTGQGADFNGDAANRFGILPPGVFDRKLNDTLSKTEFVQWVAFLAKRRRASDFSATIEVVA
jgi:hypothetical protein